MGGFARFSSREEAGDALARMMEEETLVNPVALALPRGGIPIGLRCVKAINAPLDLLMVRKVGVPWQPELAAGRSGPPPQPYDTIPARTYGNDNANLRAQ
jgi:putative phosphoribosyl transferase